VRFTLLDETSDDPVVSAELPTPRARASMRSAWRCGASLELNKEYEWSALALTPRDSARDVVASG
jgi:hypothetical protein